ncbi:hypothetical protein [Desulfobacter postgatei]|uniref:FlgN protein n=1 Tax=Desulfobacter postgatei 2ac9 TaxID=879212 RepID=I5B5A3_9BACT|nr:hypothetical protein [Desulfobacter postgatei]EIM64666.1 hypothetical protein DespoDRAFT_02848 [Desulfobacter postgatei 2ac9]
MKKNFKAVEDTLNRLYDIQADHLASFDKQALPDLEQQSAERDIEVSRLIRNVDILVKQQQIETGAETESMVFFLNNRVTKLLEQNRALQVKVHAVRDNIKNRMKQLSKGTSVIGSYRSSATAASKAKVISITN